MMSRYWPSATSSMRIGGCGRKRAHSPSGRFNACYWPRRSLPRGVSTRNRGVAAKVLTDPIIPRGESAGGGEASVPAPLIRMIDDVAVDEALTVRLECGCRVGRTRSGGESARAQ